MKQKLLAAATALGLLLCAATPALAAPEVDVTKAVIDNADILSQETEDYITDVSVSLQESCGAQIGVYTVEYIGNSTAEGYAYELFNAWGLGDADKDNGVLLLLIPGEDNYYVSRGAGIETQLPISTLSTILQEQMLDDWDAGNYDSGTQKTVAALADKLCRIYGVSLDLDTNAAGGGSTAPVPANKKGGLGFMGTLLVIIAVVLVILAIGSLFRPRGGVGSNLFWFGLGRASRPRRTPPPPPPPRRSPPPPPRRNPPPPPRGGFGGPGMGGPSGGSFRAGGGSSRSGGVGRSGGMGGRSSGGSFRAGGGSSRGGGVGKR